MRTVLHVGCGSKGNQLPREFAPYREIRLDCNPAVAPDVLASIVAMPMIPDGTHDVVFGSHVLEHLYCHEVAMALGEFFRVLKPGGQVAVMVPDLQSIGGLLALDNPDKCLYVCGLGGIYPLDMIYGHTGSVGSGNAFMAHKYGFTASVLRRALETAGFENVMIDREAYHFELRAVGHKKLDSIFGVGGAAEGMVNVAGADEVT